MVVVLVGVDLTYLMTATGVCWMSCKRGKLRRGRLRELMFQQVLLGSNSGAVARSSCPDFRSWRKEWIVRVAGTKREEWR